MGHHVYFPDLSEHPAGAITITGEEAHHALRVKRLEIGDPVVVLDGQGRVGHTRIKATAKTRDGWGMELGIDRLEHVPPTAPAVSVATATPKGERLTDMVDGLSQVGAHEWRPITTRRTVVDPRESKLDRLERTTIESMKQCGRPWRLHLRESQTFKQVLNGAGRIIIADASGDPYQATGDDSIMVIIGPEGGWDPAEIELALSAGSSIKLARFGPHVLRTELAAVIAASHVLTAEQAFRSRAV